MTPEQIKGQAVETIYLFPGECDGETCLVWCDDPAPSEGMDASEAVEYVRKDVHEARIAELEQAVALHEAAETMQIALREKAEEREQALAAYIDRLSKAVEACMSDDERKFVFTPDDYAELESALEAKFSESLARRDALKQADILNYMAGEIRSMHAKASRDGIAAHLSFIAREYLKAAEAQQ